MGNVSSWFKTAAGNNTGSTPDYPIEGQAPSTVNDCMRENMAAVARWYADANGTLTTSGTGNAYTLTTNSGYTALADLPVLTFKLDRANTGAATLNVDGLGAKSIRWRGDALVSGALAAGSSVSIAYDSANDRFELLTMIAINPDLVPDLDAAKVTSGVFAVARIPNLPGERITSGTIADARLPTTQGGKIFTGTVSFDTQARFRSAANNRGVRLQDGGAAGGYELIRTDGSGAAISANRLLVFDHSTGEVSIRAAGAEHLRTVANAVANLSGASVADSGGNLRAVGFNVMLDTVENGSRNIASGDAGRAVASTSGSSHTYTLTDTRPGGFTCVIKKRSGAGTLTISGGAGTTLNLYDGSGSLTTASSFTLAIGGVCTAHHVGSGVWDLWGTGLAPV